MRTWYRNLLFLGSFLLVACSGHTVYRLEANLLSFLPQREGTLGVQAGSADAFFPAREGQSISLPWGKVLVDGRFRGTVRLTNNSAGNLEGTLEVRVGPGSDTDLFDGNGDVAWGSSSFSLGPGEMGSFELDLSLDPNGQAFRLIQRGAFRIGARLEVRSTGAGQVDYTLDALDLTLRLRPFNLIPDN